MPWVIVGKWIAGILGGLAVAWIAYAGLIRPTTKPPVTSKYEAENMKTYTYSPKVSFGCINIKIPREEFCEDGN
jgi:hypothetical protein